MSVSVTESSIMPLYDHDDRTITETDTSSRWLPGLSLEALKLAFSASGDDWGGHPGDISVSSMKSQWIHISWMPNKISWEYVALRLIDNKPSMVQIMGCRRAGDNPIIWTNDGTVYWRIYEIRPRWVKGRWPRRSFWRHLRFSDYITIVFVFTVYCVLGTSLLLWIYAPIYSYYCPYKHYLLPMCFKCLYILLLYILCIYLFMYWKSGTSDLLVLMFFVLQCTDYKQNFLALTLTLTNIPISFYVFDLIFIITFEFRVFGELYIRNLTVSKYC